MGALRACITACASLLPAFGCGDAAGSTIEARRDSSHDLDEMLAETLTKAGFTGTIESELETRLGRPLDPRLAHLGNLLFHDKILGLHDDNSCAGCHGAANGFGDSQPMAIGVDNNGLVGPDRSGPRNQRRSPLVANTIFYPALMWTPRFVALSGDPFHSPEGFLFPPPENVILGEPTLLAAQGSLPSTELVEMAGFTGTCQYGVLDPRFCEFDDGHGQALPVPSSDGTFNFPIQDAVDARLNDNRRYRQLFGEVFNSGRPLKKGDITISMRRRAIAEFQASITAADAPLDRFARGEHDAMTDAQKRGALLFFGDAGCVTCHAVAGNANEMFSDFEPHRIGGPQLAPVFGPGTGNVIFDGPGENEDFGFEQTEGDEGMRYAFRTAPLRNLKVSPAFFHNGAFATIGDAILHHFQPVASLATYEPDLQGVPPDLQEGPFAAMLAAGLDDDLPKTALRDDELDDLVDFVENALFDPKVLEFCALVPDAVPSGLPVGVFQDCP